MSGVLELPELRELRAGADHVDVKTIEADTTLRQFIAAAVGWKPAWLKLLFVVRAGFARVLRLKHPDVRPGGDIAPEDVPFTPGKRLSFFTVDAGVEDRLLILSAADTHLTGYLALAAEPLAGRTRFHAITVVRYHNSAGPLYFNVIRPFHHFVVRGMIKAGARSARAGD